jgi:hypothetical protein
VPTPVIWGACFVVFIVVAMKAINFVLTYADDSSMGSQNPLTRAIEGQKAVLNEATKRTSDTLGGATSAFGPPPPPPDSSSSESAPPAAGPGVEEPGAAPSGDSEPEIVVGAAPKEAQEAPSKEWKLRGTVFDLVTLKPVAKATLVFSDPELNRRFELVTDGQGRYRTIVPSLPNRGYAVAVQHSDYAQSYLNPDTKGVRSKSEQKRRELAQSLEHAVETYSVQGHGKKPVETDFYLAPLRPN